VVCVLWESGSYVPVEFDMTISFHDAVSKNMIVVGCSCCYVTSTSRIVSDPFYSPGKPNRDARVFMHSRASIKAASVLRRFFS